MARTLSLPYNAWASRRKGDIARCVRSCELRGRSHQTSHARQQQTTTLTVKSCSRWMSAQCSRWMSAQSCWKLCMSRETIREIKSIKINNYREILCPLLNAYRWELALLHRRQRKKNQGLTANNPNRNETKLHRNVTTSSIVFKMKTPRNSQQSTSKANKGERFWNRCKIGPMKNCGPGWRFCNIFFACLLTLWGYWFLRTGTPMKRSSMDWNSKKVSLIGVPWNVVSLRRKKPLGHF